jgi:hypothetical protein
LGHNRIEAKTLEYRDSVGKAQGVFFTRSATLESEQKALTSVERVLQLGNEVRSLQGKPLDDGDIIAARFLEYRAILKAELGDSDGALSDLQARQNLIETSEQIKAKGPAAVSTVRLPEFSVYLLVAFDLKLELNLANVELSFLMVQDPLAAAQAVAALTQHPLTPDEIKQAREKAIDPSERTKKISHALQELQSGIKMLKFMQKQYPREQDYVFIMNYLKMESKIQIAVGNVEEARRALTERIAVAHERLDFVRNYKGAAPPRLPEFLTPDLKYITRNALNEFLKGQQDLASFNSDENDLEGALAAERSVLRTLDSESELKSAQTVRFQTRAEIANLLFRLGRGDEAVQEVESAGATSLGARQEELRSDWETFADTLIDVAKARDKVGNPVGAAQAAAQALSALELQQRSPAGPATAETLASACLYASWYLLFARKPFEAATIAQKGLDFKPKEPWPALLNTNLAHGLLFQDRFDEALKVYETWKDKPVGKNRRFAQAVLDDFDAFERAGLRHPKMAEIQASMQAAVADPSTVQPKSR